MVLESRPTRKLKERAGRTTGRDPRRISRPLIGQAHISMARVDDPATKDLNEGRAEGVSRVTLGPHLELIGVVALHALLHSLAPGSSSDTSGGKLSAEQVRKLSDKLGEILGDKAEAGDGAKRNEKGEVCLARPQSLRYAHGPYLCLACQ